MASHSLFVDTLDASAAATSAVAPITMPPWPGTAVSEAARSIVLRM